MARKMFSLFFLLLFRNRKWNKWKYGKKSNLKWFSSRFDRIFTHFSVRTGFVYFNDFLSLFSVGHFFFHFAIEMLDESYIFCSIFSLHCCANILHAWEKEEMFYFIFCICWILNPLHAKWWSESIIANECSLHFTFSAFFSFIQWKIDSIKIK